ncbi:MAG: metallophosphoesterase [Saprospiraceae bacterium]|nr:metallophosphoesterase [Saprospiraceae bacterium]
MNKICILSDLHISDKNNFPMQIDTRVNFVKVLNNVQIQNPGFIILAGDLCHTSGDREIYHWIKEKMDFCRIPYKVIAGNHDDAVLISEIFGFESDAQSNELYYGIEWGGRNILFLDSSKAYFQQNQWEWLENQIAFATSKNIFLIMHHPPVKCYSIQLEPKYAFEQTVEFIALCSKYPEKDFHIFCGHYHLERTVSIQNITVYITPSTFVQVDPDAIDFVPLHPYVGYRELFFDTQGTIITNCRYI